MRTFDFVIQTILFSALLFVLPLGKDTIIWAAVFQFFMGCWQLLSAIATSFGLSSLTTEGKKKIKLYWLLVLIYFVGWGVLYLTKNPYIWGTWFFLAWGIAIYYYVFTIKSVFQKEKSES